MAELINWSVLDNPTSPWPDPPGPLPPNGPNGPREE